MRRWGALVGPLVACLILLRLARRVDVVQVRGTSMVPALQPGDRLLAIRVARPPRPGEIVLAPDPRDPSRELVKRVGSVDATGVRLHGDNPDFSTDARVFGAIPLRDVRWRIVARTWPLRRAGPIRRRAPLAVLDEEGGELACAVPESLVAGAD